MVKQRSSSTSKNTNSNVTIRRDGRGVHKAGRITINPFLNFLREMRKKTQGLTPTELTSKGAEIWRNMSKTQKEPYCALAKQAARRSRRRRKSRRGRRRRRGRSRHRSTSSDSQGDSFLEAKRGRRRSKGRRKRSRRRRRR